jgi:putative endonuclease
VIGFTIERHPKQFEGGKQAGLRALVVLPPSVSPAFWPRQRARDCSPKKPVHRHGVDHCPDRAGDLRQTGLSRLGARAPLKPSTWLRKLVYFLCAGIISDTDRGMSEKRPCVYILASERNSTLYVGVTSNITRRAWEHRSNAAGGFVRDYGVHRIMFVEFHEIMTDAILREKRIKKWRHAWKLQLIERHNPRWRDLFDELA